MPATSPDALARKQRRKFERRKERRREEAGYSHKETKQRASRAKRDPTHAREKAKAKQREIRDGRPFVGCDGEGIGRDGEHRYALFRMGARELYRDGARLTTPDLLDFITRYPDPTAILVAFAFDYDVSNILRDLATERARRLLSLDVASRGGEANPFERFGGWTWLRFEGYPTFGVQYIPRNYLKVCRGVTQPGDDDRPKRTFALPSTVRTIYDTWGFFQGSFLAALNKWEIGREHWQNIAAMKAARSTFDAVTAEVRAYCAIECDLLADMMTAFRAACLSADIRPRTWNGAGKLAAALLSDHGVMRRTEVETRVPAGALKLAHEAYYGGRFEVTRCGLIDRPVWERDINSAYPSAMLDLPCLEHGTWRKAKSDELRKALRSNAIFVAPTAFSHPRHTFLCGFPFRSKKDGRLSWPREGRGVYWSVETRSAIKLGASVTIGDGWLYEPDDCGCKPFDWIGDLYEFRRALGKAARGVPMKLGYNSVYGKFAQRVGRPAYQNPIYAGLITAITRAKLNDAIAITKDPRQIMMIATDALFGEGPPPKLKVGEGLGEWSPERHASLFIVRPGLWWGPKPRMTRDGKPTKFALKSRGLSPKFFEPRVPDFRKAWASYQRKAKAHGVLAFPPVVPVTVETFVGLRLAHHLNKPELACQWITRAVHCKFESGGGGGKRTVEGWDGKAEILGSRPGDFYARSASYQAGKLLDTSGAWEEERLWWEAMPDPQEMNSPYTE